MVSEHATRLASMQAITEELLKIVAGFEILRTSDLSAEDGR